MKKVLLIGILIIILFISGCFPKPICGDDACDFGEEMICPKDCEFEKTCSEAGGYECDEEEYCNSDILGNIKNCCSTECEKDKIIELKEGKHFVSIPSTAFSDTIDESLIEYVDYIEGIYSYDSVDGWKVWHPSELTPSDLERFETGKGYIFVLKEDFDLNFTKVLKNKTTAATPLSLKLNKGWNLVGIPSSKHAEQEDILWNIEGKYSSIVEFDNGEYKKIEDDALLEPGKSYWIYMEEEGLLIQ